MLARGEPLDRAILPPPREQLGDDVGVERGATGGDASHRLEEVGYVHHPVLEQVADAAPAVGQQLRGVGRLDVLGDHEYGSAGDLAAHLERGAQALVAEGGGQADVHDREIGAPGDHLADQRIAVADRGHHFDVVVAQQAGQAVAQEHVILGDDYPHGNSA